MSAAGWLARRISCLVLLCMLPVAAAAGPPVIRAGDVTMYLLHDPGGTPHADQRLALSGPYPGAEPIRARTDARGRAVLTVPSGRYLLLVEGAGLGLINADSQASASTCTIIWPPDYPQPPIGRPELHKLPADDISELLLLARQVPVDAPVAASEESMDVTGEMTLDRFLQKGLLGEGMAHFAEPADNWEMFSLAALQALNALRQFTAGLDRFSYRPELQQSFENIPFLRLVDPRARGGAGVRATPEKVALLFNDLAGGLREANRTVSRIDDQPFKVEVNLTRIHWPASGLARHGIDNTLTENLSLLFDIPARGPRGEDIVVRFDNADAKWLEAYTHLAGGLLEFIGAYDWLPLWDHAAPLLFSFYDPEPCVIRHLEPAGSDGWADLLDWIAALHSLRLDVRDPAGIERARDSLLQMVSCSRRSWELILAETDDDHEWIPGPHQTGPGGTLISQAQVDGWLQVLDELENILNGDLLLPHFRLLPGRGINVDRLVSDPPRLDPVMWLQGQALGEYIEEGPVSDRARWNHLVAPFNNRFGRFALWVN